MTNKKTFRTIITVAVMLAVVLGAIVLFGTLDTAAAEGAKTPIYDASSKDIYAQGTHIYIVDGTNGGTAVYYLSGSSKVYVNPNGAAGDDLSDFAIRGGGDGYVLAGDVNITMTGGKVNQISCTGGGSTVADQSLGNVQGNAYVTVTGGTITKRLTVSWYNPFIGSVNFKITGGTIGNVYGYVERSNHGYPDCRVHGSSTVSITGSATITGEVGLGDGYYPVSGTKTLVTTVPVKLKASSTLATPEDNMENFLYKNGSTWKVKGNVTIPEGATLTVNSGETLSVPSRATLNNNGTIVNNGNSDIKGTVNNNGSASCTTHNYSYACDTTCNLCGATRSASCEYDAGSMTVEGSKIVIKCKYCGTELGTVELRADDKAYTASPYSPNVSSLGVKLESYTITYTNENGNLISTPIRPGNYTVTMTYVHGVKVSDTFTITKANLAVKENPKVYRIFGEDADTKPIEAVIVIEGTNVVVSGTWTREWGGNYLLGKFTATGEHAPYVNALERQKLEHVVSPANPVITISSPSPAIMPGMKIKLNVTIKNPYADTGVLLPPDVSVTYKVGQNGTPVTVEGTEFTLPTDGAALGDTLYVTVNTEAHFGYYNAGTSNTVTIFVGQLDYTADIEKVQTNLDEAIERLEGVDAKNAKDLADAITSLNSAIEAAKTAAQNADASLRAELVAKIEDADKALDDKINQVQTNLDSAVARLEAANQKNADDLAKAIADLNAAVDAAEAAAEAADAALKAELVAKIEDADKALDDKINQVQKNLDDAVTRLEAADKKNADDLAQAILDLNAAIDAAEAAAAAARAELKAELVKKIDDADAILQANIDKVQENLDNEVDRLDQVDKENSEALAQAIKDLQTAIKTSQAVARAVAYTADRELKASLSEKIEAADVALEALIAEVSANLEAAVKALEAADEANSKDIAKKYAELDVALQAAKAVLNSNDEALKEADALLRTSIEALEEKDQQLNTMSIVAIVLGSLGVLGNVGLIAWTVYDKKRR